MTNRQILVDKQTLLQKVGVFCVARVCPASSNEAAHYHTVLVVQSVSTSTHDVNRGYRKARRHEITNCEGGRRTESKYVYCNCTAQWL